MDLKEMRNLTKEELTEKRLELKRELFNLRVQHVSGKAENPARFRQVRKDIARIETILNEKRRPG